MPVPEAAMDEYGLLFSFEHDIGPPGQPSVVKAVP